MATSRLAALWNHPAGPKTSKESLCLSLSVSLSLCLSVSLCTDHPLFRSVLISILYESTDG